MQTKNFLRATLVLTLIFLSSCGQAPNKNEESCVGAACSEADINAPVGDGAVTGIDALPIEVDSPLVVSGYSFPPFNSSWGLDKKLFDKAQSYYYSKQNTLGNPRYVTIVDMGMRSSQKRMFIFDLKTQTVERHLTAHGKNSDLDNDGYATSFSNEFNSKKTSLGFYKTLSTYNGGHGLSLKLRGLESSNSNAEARAVVMHPADYVDESRGTAGRSWGCPAIDPRISRSVINRLKSGSLLLIDR